MYSLVRLNCTFFKNVADGASSYIVTDIRELLKRHKVFLWQQCRTNIIFESKQTQPCNTHTHKHTDEGLLCCFLSNHSNALCHLRQRHMKEQQLITSSQTQLTHCCSNRNSSELCVLQVCERGSTITSSSSSQWAITLLWSSVVTKSPLSASTCMRKVGTAAWTSHFTYHPLSPYEHC